MVIKKRPEPALPGEAEFLPKLRGKFIRGEKLLLSSLRGIRSASGRSNSKRGARGKVRIPKEYNQRVLVKARVVKLEGKKGLKNLRSHLHYLTRSGVGLKGDTPEFTVGEERLSREELSKRLSAWETDPHLFRFIVSPERGPNLDLEQFSKDLMRVVERDLKTKLQWFGVSHYNTDNPHVHLVVRGLDENGKALFMSRDYIQQGMRHAAELEATRTLGKRNAREVREGIRRDLNALKITPLDGTLLKEQAKSREKTIKTAPLSWEMREWERQLRQDKLTRLAFLKKHGLAHEVSTGVWHVSENASDTLRELSRRQQVRKLIRPYLTEAKQTQPLVIYDQKTPLVTPTTGEVAVKDFSNELYDRRFVLLSGEDGRNHFVELSRFSEPRGFEVKRGAVVTLAQAKRHNRADDVIDQFAKNNGGVFEVPEFSKHVAAENAAGRWKIPGELSLDEYIERFKTRAEALSNAGIIKPREEAAWEVPSDLKSQVEELDKKLGKAKHVELQVKSYFSLSEQSAARGATWLDSLLEKKQGIPSDLTAFGRDVTDALKKREEHLKSEGIKIEPGLMKVLRTRELKDLRERLSPSLGQHVPTKIERPISGRVHGYELLSDGYYLVVKQAEGFTLVKARTMQGRFAKGTAVQVSATLKRGESGERTLSIRVQRKSSDKSRVRTRSKKR